jgi:hypothetical protein
VFLGFLADVACFGRTKERPVAKAPLFATDFQGPEDPCSLHKDRLTPRGG